MLRSVVSDFISSVKNERDLDSAFMAMLGANSYTDIHFTHGATEIGKDFIAKKKSEGGLEQYVFQNKAGDLDLRDWRSIAPQLFDTVVLGLHHPGFDSSLKRRGVLVLTGRIGSGVSPTIDLFNESLKERQCQPIEVWHHDKLVELFSDVDPTVVYPLDAKGISAYGDFFGLYGKALKGELRDLDIEHHSRNWIGSAGEERSRLFVAAIEANTIASASNGAGDTYGACFAVIAMWRAVMAAFLASKAEEYQFIHDLMERACAGVSSRAWQHAEFVNALRISRGGKLVNASGGAALFVTYPIQCFRLGEMLALRYYTAGNPRDRELAVVALRKLVLTEKGCHHPPSDKYAVSVVAIGRALFDGGEKEIAVDFAREVATWVFAQYAGRSGLGSIEDSEEESLFRLLGHEINGVARPRRDFSFLATALADLAAYFGNRQLFTMISNDLRANHMCAEYFQPLDTMGQLLFQGEDVVRIHNVELTDELSDNSAYAYAPHLADEPRDFRLASEFGAGPLLAVSLLLRDRYFPTIWRSVARLAS